MPLFKISSNADFMSVFEYQNTGNAQVIKIPGYILKVTSCQNWGLYHNSIFSFKSTWGWAGMLFFLHKHNNFYILQLRIEILISYSYLCWSLLDKVLSQFQCSSSIFCRIMPKHLFTLNLPPRASKSGVQAGYLVSTLTNILPFLNWVIFRQHSPLQNGFHSCAAAFLWNIPKSYCKKCFCNAEQNTVCQVWQR